MGSVCLPLPWARSQENLQLPAFVEDDTGRTTVKKTNSSRPTKDIKKFTISAGPNVAKAFSARYISRRWLG